MGDLLAAFIGVMAMLMYVGFIFAFWFWLFKKSMECFSDNLHGDDVEFDYSGFKKLSFKKKCAYLYMRMWIEIFAIFTIAILLSYSEDKESVKYKKANEEATKFSRLMWLGNKIGFLFILAFSVIGGIFISLLIEHLKVWMHSN